ncbi:MAG: hypothetical protein ABMB14_40575, partial [Myxococcota bacterium]
MAPLWLAVAIPGCTGGDGGQGSDDSDSDTDSGEGDDDDGTTCPTDAGTACATIGVRVDLYEPVFSNPTVVTNPLFPVSELASVVFTGVVGGEPFRTETTLLPYTTTLEWDGYRVEALTSQYMAFSNGRIEEIAFDFYVQDDLGAVWYLGEDVSDYDADGVVYTNEGTWRVGRDGAPQTMIMPAEPQVGDVFLAENVAPIAWEEVTVVEVGAQVDGPDGPIAGAMIGSELHMDGTREQKVFAPGHGEFSTGALADDNLEAQALAIPADALAGPVEPELVALATATAGVYDAAAAGDWTAASAALVQVDTAWAAFTAGSTPPRLTDELDRVLALLDAGVTAQDTHQATQNAIEVARIGYDLQLRRRPPTEIDAIRLDLWLAQVAVDVAAGDAGSVRGDSATLDLVWIR